MDSDLKTQEHSFFSSAPVVSNEYDPSFTRRGDLIFASNRGFRHSDHYNLYRAIYKKGQYAEVMPFPKGVNLRGYEADPFYNLGPDNRYLLFFSSRTGAKGPGDIYVSFRLGKSVWSSPQAVTSINTGLNALLHQRKRYLQGE